MNRYLIPAALLLTGAIFAAAPPPRHSESAAPPSVNHGFADVVAKDLPGVVSIYTTLVEKTAGSDPLGLGIPQGARRRKRKSA
ncbi:MAG: hypothetical protein JNM56_16920, partial [Planctomycetia bacterium]|nr:hypothetical protein [Planctomycetia bacterium]